MSPGARELHRDAISSIEWDAIKHFVTNARVLVPGTFSELPYVVANESDRHMATVKDLTYVRGIDGRVGEEYAIVRLRHIYYDDNGVMKRAEHHRYGEHLPDGLEYPMTSGMRHCHGGARTLKCWVTSTGTLRWEDCLRKAILLSWKSRVGVPKLRRVILYYPLTIMNMTRS